MFGSSANDGTYTVASISDDLKVLTLEPGARTLTPEGPSKDIAVTLAGSAMFRVASVNGSPSANKLGVLRADADADLNNDGVTDAGDGDGLIAGVITSYSIHYTKLYDEPCALSPDQTCCGVVSGY